MNRLIKDRLIRFAKGNDFKARTVERPDGDLEAQLLFKGEVILSVPKGMLDSLRRQLRS